MKTSIISIYILFSLAFLTGRAQPIDSLFMDLEMISISENEYQKLHDAKTKEPIDYYKNLGLDTKTDCDQICETYIFETNSDKKMYLPSSFDAGILGITFSPSGNKLLVYSSYDDPDFDDYYFYRADFYIYSIGKKPGLEALQLFGNYYSMDWSIEDMIWVNDQTVALKVYKGQRSMAGTEGGYSYLKTKIDSKE